MPVRTEDDDLAGAAATDEHAPVPVTVTHGPASLYSAELADRIVREVESGRTLHDVCRDRGIPAYSTVRGWMMRGHDGFAARLRRARAVNRGRRSRATIYTDELAERILRELFDGRPLCDICLDEGMPAYSTVKLWVSEDREGFAVRYRHAREVGRPRRGGHPTVYTAELADHLLRELANGRTLTDICDDEGMPCHATVRNWVLEDREGFAARFSRARCFGYQAMSDRIIDIADDGRNDWQVRHRKDGTTELVIDHENIKRSRLRCDARRWNLATTLPKLYAEQTESLVKYDPNDSIKEMMRQIEERNRGLTMLERSRGRDED